MARNNLFLYGKNSVVERIKNNPSTVKNIFIKEDFDDHNIVKLIKKTKISFRFVSQKQLLKIKKTNRTQGIIAEVKPFEYSCFEDLVLSQDKNRLSFLFLDNIYDPHNLGAIIRTAACFGRFAVVIAKHRACEINDTVLHVACGGENFVPIAMGNLSQMLIFAKAQGFWVAGAVVGKGKDIGGIELPFPVCFVLGSEGKGIRPGIEKHLQLKVNLPMQGAKLSFNVSVACGIACYEIAKQRK